MLSGYYIGSTRVHTRPYHLYSVQAGDINTVGNTSIKRGWKSSMASIAKIHFGPIPRGQVRGVFSSAMGEQRRLTQTF